MEQKKIQYGEASKGEKGVSLETSNTWKAQKGLHQYSEVVVQYRGQWKNRQHVESETPEPLTRSSLKCSDI